MKTEIGSYEAKTKLPELLRQVKAGKSFTITNRGEAIADLVPSAGARVKDKVAGAGKLKAFMLADPVRVVNIKKLIEDNLRFRAVLIKEIFLIPSQAISTFAPAAQRCIVGDIAEQIQRIGIRLAGSRCQLFKRDSPFLK